MKCKNKILFFAIFCVLMLGIFFFILEPISTSEKYEFQFAYPVSSISPLNYDDWESIFIGNHIYIRLLPEKNRPFIPFITDKLQMSCALPKKIIVDDSCQRIKISFKPHLFHDCMNRSFTVSDIKLEFEKILNSKKWIVPDWKRCNENNGSICVEGRYAPDQIRRMYGIAFRFGWSKTNKNDAMMGAGPYCLKSSFDENGDISAGLLIPNEKEKLPIISFHTSQKATDHFDVAIYGGNNLLNPARENIQAHTPLAYYVVTNPALAIYSLPWNTAETKNIIHDFMASNEVIFKNVPQFINFAPEGGALKKKNRHLYSRGLVFAMPNYITGCEKLAIKLNENWKKSSKAKAVCVDIVDYVIKNVQRKEKHWGGFFVGVSASDSTKNSIRDEYFSPTSGGWIENYAAPDKLFYLVGIGQSLLTIENKKICGIRPNPLGLSDIFVTDLLSCRRW